MSRIITLFAMFAVGCVLPPFDATGKTCSQTDPCPSGWRCAAEGTCTSTAAIDAGTSDGGLWQPVPGTSWQIQLSGTLDRGVDASVFAVNLFDVPQADVDALKATGRRVICQVSAGVAETARADVGQLSAAVLGNTTSGPVGKWVDTRASAVRQWMAARFDVAKQKGCDAVEPTDVDSFQSSTGFPLNQASAVDYVRALAGEAHSRGLAIGMSNVVELSSQLVDHVDFARNESCLQFSECQGLTVFTQRNKAVFHLEFGNASNLSSVCAARPSSFSTILKQTSLDAWRAVCP